MSVANKETRTESQIESEMDINKSLSTDNRYYIIIEVVTSTNTQLKFSLQNFLRGRAKKEKEKKHTLIYCFSIGSAEYYSSLKP